MPAALPVAEAGFKGTFSSHDTNTTSLSRDNNSDASAALHFGRSSSEVRNLLPPPPPVPGFGVRGVGCMVHGVGCRV